MVRHTAARPSSVLVVVLVLEVRDITEVTVERRAVPAPFSTCISAAQAPPLLKSESVVTVQAGVSSRLSEFHENKIRSDEAPTWLGDNSEAVQETSTRRPINRDINCTNKECNARDSISYKPEAKIIIDENCNTILKAPQVEFLTEPPLDISLQEQHSLEDPTAALTTFDHTKANAHSSPSHLKVGQLLIDLCTVHRECVREVSRGKQFAPLRKMEEHCNGNNDCGEVQGCHKEGSPSPEWKTGPSKGTSITECLNEFLEELHLGHLADYLRVLGCTCVRDLRLLEKPELEAIQLISRRRLLQQLETINLHHEAPPSDCSLEGWLTWYGLTHISGFLSAIGVHSVGDLIYLKEEDLSLLKPVTRRRIITCNRK